MECQKCFHCKTCDLFKWVKEDIFLCLNCKGKFPREVIRHYIHFPLVIDNQLLAKFACIKY